MLNKNFKFLYLIHHFLEYLILFSLKLHFTILFFQFIINLIAKYYLIYLLLYFLVNFIVKPLNILFNIYLIFLLYSKFLVVLTKKKKTKNFN